MAAKWPPARSSDVQPMKRRLVQAVWLVFQGAIVATASEGAPQFPISGAYGDHDACTVYRAGGAVAVYQSQITGTLVLPTEVIEAGMDCYVTRILKDDSDFNAVIACSYSADRKIRTPTERPAYAGTLPGWYAKSLRGSARSQVIWYAEGRAGSVLSPCVN